MAHHGHRPGLLLILDGFAFGDPNHPCNAVALADTPVLDGLLAAGPATTIDNNAHHVGLPPGQMGNSEVGHLNIGAGRIVYQDFSRINNAIAEGTFATNAALKAAIDHAKQTGGRLHLIGLLGTGGVHAHEDHFAAALQAAAAAGVAPDDVLVHPIGDGRDTAPRSATDFIVTLQQQMAAAGVGRIVDFVGRYWAMDRDNRWERTADAYHLYRDGTADRSAPDAVAAVAACHAAGEDDEFARPTRIAADGTVRDGDAVVWLNFRPDRSRQMTRAFMQPDFDGFDRPAPQNLLWLCTTQYDDAFVAWPGIRIAYPPTRPRDTLGEHVAALGLRQLRVAETEKYAHVTYFMNGGREAPFEGEQRILVPSPRVATYDLQPEMSAGEVTDHVVAAIEAGEYDLIVVNYANGDMVGHTGNLDAATQAVTFMDRCLGRVLTAADAAGFIGLVTSDHGNCEEMCTTHHDGSAADRLTQHSMLPSPLLGFGVGPGVGLVDGGALCNVAPTLLDLMGLPAPAAMSADSLVQRQTTR